MAGREEKEANKEIWKLSERIWRGMKENPSRQSLYDAMAPLMRKYIHDAKMVEKIEEQTDISDEELRQKLRAHLLVRLEEKSIQASEIAQLKDVFGLTERERDIIIEVINYADKDG